MGGRRKIEKICEIVKKLNYGIGNKGRKIGIRKNIKEIEESELMKGKKKNIKMNKLD